MNSCFIEITLEFLGVAFHNILYYASIYPKCIFEPRRKYSIVVYRSIHPEVNEYIDLCLKSIAECLKTRELKRLEFVITTNAYEVLLKFVFDLDKNDEYDETNDAYLVQAEQNMRAFCLKLSTLSDHFQALPEDRSFVIQFTTNESEAVALTSNPQFENFPLVEVEENLNECQKILPIRRFNVKNFNLNTYVELSRI